MMNSVVAGMHLSDLIVEGKSPLEDVYEPMRFNEDAWAHDFQHQLLPHSPRKQDERTRFYDSEEDHCNLSVRGCILEPPYREWVETEKVERDGVLGQ
jgi:hypothetical protein